MLNKLYNFIFKHQLRKNLRILLSQKYFTETITDIKIINKENWTTKMEMDILKLLNSNTVTNLSRYIDSSLAEQIVKDRNENGPYNSFIELSNKIPYDILSKLYHLYSDDYKTLKKFRTQVTPDIRRIQIPESIVGIHIGFDAISWAVVTYNYKILDLDCIQLDDILKFNSYILTNMVVGTVQQLPSSYCYVFEDLEAAPKFMKIINHRRQLSVAIMSCLKLRNELSTSDELPKEHSVYVLRPQSVAKFYKLRVGGEVVATQYILNKIFDNVDQGETEFRYIYINDETKQKFYKKDPTRKEEIGCSLLKALMFLDLLELFSNKKPVRKTSDNFVI